MKNKGQAMSISQIFVSLMTIGLITTLILLFFTQYFDIRGIVKESSEERHAITLAQVFLSSDQLVFVDEENVAHRAMFDREKLDENFINNINDLRDFDKLHDIFENSPLFQEMSYPNSTYILQVEDLENNIKWMIFGHGKIAGLDYETANHVKCIVDVSKKTKKPSISDYLGCMKRLGSKTGVSEKKFPVTVRISDEEVHIGIMTIMSTEL